MRHPGYTLFELVLVMALIVVAASITFPLADSLLNPNKLTVASDRVRTQWAEMRARAMEEGRPYRFSVMENSGRFRIEPDDAGTAGNEDPGLITEGDLPDDVVFVKSEDVLLGAAAAPSPGATWEPVAVYLPDGTARDDVTLCFGLPGMRPVSLRLRALTGAVSAVEVKP